MKRKQRKLALSRETLRRLDDMHLRTANGGGTALCTTTAQQTECQVCHTTDVTDCPDGCEANTFSLGCPTGVNSRCNC